MKNLPGSNISISAGRSLVQITTKYLLFFLVAAMMTLGQSAFAQTYQVMVPTLNPNESVVAFATPQNYGAKGDGVTDDTTAFQNAINAASAAGGGIIYVPKATYAFHGNLTVPGGVSLHGDWTDWTTGTGGCVGTTFAIYTTGLATGTPFIQMGDSTGLTGINFWYPNQNPNSITPYPYTVHAAGDAFIQNIVLINSYQGINANGASHHFIQTVIGSPLFTGFFVDNMFDVSHANDFRFSPNVWPASKLAGAPAVGGAYATWMRANGVGMLLFRADGEFCYGNTISGYKVGIEFNNSNGGKPSCSMYEVSVTNCATALWAQHGAVNGMPFTGCTFDGDVGITRTAIDELGLEFNNCTIIGRSGPAVSLQGNSSFRAIFTFQNCTITNTIQPNGCVFNLVNCTLNGSQQCVMGSNVNTRAYFTGCTFTSAQNIANYGSPGNLQVTSGTSATNTLPVVPWSTFITQRAACKPAKTTLFLASSYGATGNGATDDTAAIQSALTAAGNNGGGIVYLGGGHYKTSTTLTVPSGVKFQGTYEGFHGSDYYSSYAFGTIMQPTGGQGGTTGPVAVALSANSGVVGMTFDYVAQDGATTFSTFPPTIQGRGANVYVIGVMCPNPYVFLDLDTYACTNHFVEMVGGWALSRYILVGNGSSGSIVDVCAIPAYWTHSAGNSGNYAQANLQVLTMGDCTETVATVFTFLSHNLIYCTAENGKGPNLTGIIFGQDDSISSFTLDSAAASTINIINSGDALFGDSNNPYPGGQNPATFFIQATSQFKGTARFFNMATWATPVSEFILNGGDVGVDGYYANEGSSASPAVNAGVFHLVNYANNTTQPLYTVTYGANAGISGKTNEVIGNFAYNGIASNNLNPANPVNAWGNNTSSSSGPVDGMLCSLICQTSGKALDNGGSTTQASDVKQWGPAGNTNQRWQLTDVGGGYFNLICQTSGMALDNDNSGSNGTSLIQWPSGGNNHNQGWQFVNVGGSYPYQLINQADGKAMDNGGSTSDGTTVNQFTQASGNSDPNQNWRVVPVGDSLPTSGLVYHLICATSGMALDNTGSTTAGKQVTQWGDQNNNPNQEWEVVSNGDYYNLICQRSGMALDDDNGGANGTPAIQWSYGTTNPNQMWELILGNDYCNVISVANGLALDNEGGTTNGTPVYQWTPQPGDTNQEWEFIDNEATPQSGSRYNLICLKDAMALDNNGSTTAGSAIDQSPLVYGSTRQEWQFVSAANGTYNLICQYSGMALDNGGSTTAGGAIVQQPTQSGDTNQEWTFASNGNNFYSLICKTSGLALDNGGTTTSGAPVRQWTVQSNNANQEWQLNLLP